MPPPQKERLKSSLRLGLKLEVRRPSTLISSRSEVFCEKVVPKNFAIFTTLLLESLFIKRDSNTGVFLRIRQNF